MWKIAGLAATALIGGGMLGLYLDRTCDPPSHVELVYLALVTAGGFFVWGYQSGKDVGRGQGEERLRQALRRGAVKFNENLDSNEELAEDFPEVIEELDYLRSKQEGYDV